jgi:hypothetical protein
MLGICVLHSFTQGSLGRVSWLENILLSCVVGFCFVSGFFGIKFKMSKIVSLYFIAIWCGIVASIIGYCWGDFQGVDIITSIRRIKRYCLDGWFLNAYIILMMFAPVLNYKLNDKGLRDLIPLLILTFVWCCLGSMHGIRSVIPKASGVGAYSFVTLVGIYIGSRLCEKYKVEKVFANFKISILISLLCIPFIVLGVSSYASPFSFLVVAVVFYNIKKLQCNLFVSNLVRLISPSLFAVYLLHSNGLGFRLIFKYTLLLSESKIPDIICGFISGVTVMVVCLILDLPRRAVVFLLRKKITWVLNLIDTTYDKMLLYVSKKISSLMKNI